MYNAKTEYEFNDKVIKVGATGTKFALSRDEADRGLESLTNDIQATVGQTIEVNGVKYKISKVKHIEREVYDRDNGATFLNAQVVFALEEVSQPTGAQQDDEANQAKPEEPKEEKPVEGVKPVEKLSEELNNEQVSEVKPQEDTQAKPQDESKEEIKHEQDQEKPEVKSDANEESKQESKEESKQESKEELKNEEVKPEQKPQAKEESKQQTSVAQDTSVAQNTSETKQLPETGIAGVLEILGLGAIVSALGAASYLKKKK